MTRPQHEILRASAGTGKTYQLVERYYELIRDEQLAPEQIFALTFSRKATHELRERIERRLLEGKVAAETCERLALAPIATFHELAIYLLHLLQAEGDDAFGMLEEGGDVRLFVEVAKQLWYESEGSLAAAFARAAGHFKIDDDFIGDLFKALSRCREDSIAIEPGLLLTYDGDKLRAERHAEMLELHQIAEANPEGIYHKLKDGEVAPQLRVPAADEDPESWAHAWAAIAKRWNFNKKGAKAELGERGRTARDGIYEVPAEYAAEQCAAALETLILAAYDAYQAAKRARKKRDFADLIGGIVALLSEDEGAHRAVRERVAAVLVDEAQDTNGLQRQLVRLLVGLDGPAAASRAGMPPLARLVVVGDMKQSIYYFRGADAENFERLASEVAELGGEEMNLTVSRRSTPPLIDAINDLASSTFGASYQSAKLEPLPLEDEAGKATKAPPQPALRWWVVPSDRKYKGEKKDGTASFTCSCSVARQGQAIAAHIERLRDEGYAYRDIAVLIRWPKAFTPPLVAALAARDIPAVVAGVGTLWEQPEIRDVLSLLAWLGDETRLLDGAVALRSPLFGLSDAVLAQLFGDTSDAGAYRAQLRDGRAPALPALSTAEAAALEWAATHLAKLAAKGASLTPSAALLALDESLDVFALSAAEPDGPQKVANLEALFALAARSEASGCLTILDFVADMRRREELELRDSQGKLPSGAQAGASLDEQPASKNLGAVSVMSTHASKGLQFPVVILGGVDRVGGSDKAAVRYCRGRGLVVRSNRVRNAKGAQGPASFNRASNQHKESEKSELNNLLYVAITRAQERLEIVAPMPNQNPKELKKASFGDALNTWYKNHIEKKSPDFFQLRHFELDQLAAPKPQQANEPGATLVSIVKDVKAAATLRAPRHLSLRATHIAQLLCEHDFRLDAVATRQATHAVSPTQLAMPSEQPAMALDPLAAALPQLSAARLGTIAHGVLRYLDALPADASPTACAAWVDRTLAMLGYAPTHASLQVLRATLQSFLLGPLGTALRAVPPDRRFGEHGFARTLKLGNDRLEIHGQIDLVVVSPERLWLVDYKSRAPHGSEDAYAYQLALYAWALSDVFGEDVPAQGDLIYLGEGGRSSRYTFSADGHRQLEHQLEQLVTSLPQSTAMGRAG